MRFANRTCHECGVAYQPRHGSALFCSSTCRQAFNRRRRDRGTELYDFMMAMHAGDIKEPWQKSVIKKICDAYVASDNAKRAGRKSYQPLSHAVANLPNAYGAHGDNR